MRGLRFLLPMIVFAGLLLAGCASTTAERYEHMRAEAQAHAFVPVQFGAQPPLIGMQRNGTLSPYLWVVLEGDGHAWLSMRQPSADPTPRDAVGWRLASTLSAPAVLYLARPCQYLAAFDLRACTTDDWSDARFAEKWVARMNTAIDQAMQAAGASHVVLAGYSGGGVMAALLAARRQDVAALVTIAAPLDHQAWTAYHGVSPLTGSLSLLPLKERLSGVPQVHIVGADDMIVSPVLLQNFLRDYQEKAPAELIVLPGLDHRMQATIDLACIRSSRLLLQKAGVPDTCPSPPDRSQSR